MSKIIFAFLFCTLSLISLAQPGYSGSTPLDGFKIMALPRDYMPIGALWNLSIGPVAAGVGSESVITSNSLNNMELATDKQTRAGLELGILNFLKSSGNYEALTNSQISLEGLSIITLNSPATLANNVGQHVLYEAVKAEKIKITLEKSKVADAKLKLTQIFKNKVDFGAQTDIDNKTTLTVSGLNLYLAYRVVKIKKVNTKKQSLRFKSQSHGGTSSFTISSRYEAVTPKVTVQICPCNIIGCMLDKGNNITREEFNNILGTCGIQKGYDMTVILNDNIDMSTGKPKEYYFKVKSGSSLRNINQSLYVNPTSLGLEVSYVAFEKIIFEVLNRMGNTYLIRMLNKKSEQKSYLVTTSYEFSNVAPQSIPGW